MSIVIYLVIPDHLDTPTSLYTGRLYVCNTTSIVFPIHRTWLYYRVCANNMRNTYFLIVYLVHVYKVPICKAS